MAVVQYSALVTQLRGKLGGSQFNKGHSVQVIQRKSTPTIRQSPAQMRQRQIIGMAQRAWKDETPARQAQALASAISNPIYNRMGQQTVLSGFNQYVRVMALRLLTDGASNIIPISAPIATEPLSAALQELSEIEVVYLGSPRTGVQRISFSWQKSSTGAPTGGAALTRGDVFLRRVDESGRPLHRASEFFAVRGAFNNSYVDNAVRDVLTSQYLAAGMYLQIIVLTRDMSGGAVVGRVEYLTQLF